MVGWMDGSDRWLVGWLVGWMDGWMDGLVGWMGGLFGCLVVWLFTCSRPPSLNNLGLNSGEQGLLPPCH